MFFKIKKSTMNFFIKTKLFFFSNKNFLQFKFFYFYFYFPVMPIVKKENKKKSNIHPLKENLISKSNTWKNKNVSILMVQKPRALWNRILRSTATYPSISVPF